MCGICGFISHQQSSEQGTVDLSSMLGQLTRRGPDDVGSYHQHPAHIGMRRLAIIDIKGGHQPLIDQQSGVSLVYNGELYNYQELKKALSHTGIQFQTESDTEVILQSYLQHKHNCWTQFNSMFALALWDPKRQQLTLARDRFGQKPLYYLQRPGFFAFASDIRSLLAHPAIPFSLETECLPQYLQLRHVPGNKTFVKEIKQLDPGCYLTLDKEQNLNIQRYWSVSYHADQSMSIHDFKDQFNAIWPKAIKRHLLSDVTVGGFLSGGIDSSLIALQASKTTNFKTLSMGFNDPAFDESQWAQEISNFCACDHQRIQFFGSLSSMLELWGQAFDQPFADPASFPLLLLCQQARTQMTVALSGDGADELFGGYQRYKSLLLSATIRKFPSILRKGGHLLLRGMAGLFPAKHRTRRYLDAISRRLKLVSGDIYQEYLRQFNLFSDPTLTSLLLGSYHPETSGINTSHSNIIPNILEHDLNHWLPDQMLVKTDRASMGVSLETRLPFLDNDIVDLALRTPDALAVHNKQLKYSLRSVAADLLPPSVSQRPKHGFAVPVDQWLRDETDWVQDTIRTGLTHHQELFNVGPISNMLDQHFGSRFNHGEPLLTLLLFFVWHNNLSRFTHGSPQSVV